MEDLDKITIHCSRCGKKVDVPVKCQGKISEIVKLTGMIPIVKDKFSSVLLGWKCKDRDLCICNNGLFCVACDGSCMKVWDDLFTL
jgi:hypothetical protein